VNPLSFVFLPTDSFVHQLTRTIFPERSNFPYLCNNHSGQFIG
jgi:hypothetical protein